MKFSTQALYKIMNGLFMGMGAIMIIMIWNNENLLYHLVGVILMIIGITMMDKYASLEVNE